jgi:thiol-disulfide isomerase/thioredoxin
LWISGRQLSISRERIALSGRSSDPLVGQPVPELGLTLLDGSEMRLADFRGRAVVINYWATWCEPCKAEMPLLQRSYESNEPDLVVLGVNGGEAPADVERFVNELGLSFPIVLDPEYRAEAALGVLAYPTTVFVDSDGIIQARHIGQLDRAFLKTYLELIGIRR